MRIQNKAVKIAISQGTLSLPRPIPVYSYKSK